MCFWKDLEGRPFKFLVSKQLYTYIALLKSKLTQGQQGSLAIQCTDLMPSNFDLDSSTYRYSPYKSPWKEALARQALNLQLFPERPYHVSLALYPLFSSLLPLQSYSCIFCLAAIHLMRALGSQLQGKSLSCSSFLKGLTMYPLPYILCFAAFCLCSLILASFALQPFFI